MLLLKASMSTYNLSLYIFLFRNKKLSESENNNSYLPLKEQWSEKTSENPFLRLLLNPLTTNVPII